MPNRVPTPLAFGPHVPHDTTISRISRREGQISCMSSPSPHRSRLNLLRMRDAGEGAWSGSDVSFSADFSAETEKQGRYLAPGGGLVVEGVLAVVGRGEDSSHSPRDVARETPLWHPSGEDPTPPVLCTDLVPCGAAAPRGSLSFHEKPSVSRPEHTQTTHFLARYPPNLDLWRPRHRAAIWR